MEVGVYLTGDYEWHTDGMSMEGKYARLECGNISLFRADSEVYIENGNIKDRECSKKVGVGIRRVRNVR